MIWLHTQIDHVSNIISPLYPLWIVGNQLKVILHGTLRDRPTINESKDGRRQSRAHAWKIVVCCSTWHDRACAPVLCTSQNKYALKMCISKLNCKYQQGLYSVLWLTQSVWCVKKCLNQILAYSSMSNYQQFIIRLLFFYNSI